MALKLREQQVVPPTGTGDPTVGSGCMGFLGEGAAHRQHPQVDLLKLRQDPIFRKHPVGEVWEVKLLASSSEELRHSTKL